MRGSYRFAALAVGWTFLTAAATVTLGVLGVAVGSAMRRPALADSGPAGVLAVPLSWGFLLVGTVAVCLVPLAVAGYRHRTGTYDRVETAAWTVAALAATPAVPLAWHSYDVDTAGVVALAVAGLAALALALARTDGSATVHFRRLAPWQFAHVGLAAVLVVGFAVGVSAGASGSALVETRNVAWTTPQIHVESNYTAAEGDRGVVTITHAGGEAVPVDRIRLNGTGFADVRGANQTAPGPWQGSSDRNGTLTEGDSVAVGVERDCRLRVVYVDDGERTTIGLAECEELR